MTWLEDRLRKLTIVSLTSETRQIRLLDTNDLLPQTCSWLTVVVQEHFLCPLRTLIKSLDSRWKSTNEEQEETRH
jgi:hypothetical protein